MKFPNTYLCFGAELEACVVTISDHGRALLEDQLRLALKHEKESLRHEAYRKAFGVAAQYAVPCWIDECMAALVESPAGSIPDRARQLAACTLLGHPYGVKDPRDGSDGGQKSELTDKPQRKPPGGAKVETNLKKRGAKVTSAMVRAMQ